MLYWYKRTISGHFHWATRLSIIHISIKKTVWMVILKSETFDLTRWSMRSQGNQNSQSIQLKWQFVFLNASEKVLVSLKYIIHILTVSSLKHTVFDLFRVKLVRIASYHSDTCYYRYNLNDQLYILTYIFYYTDMHQT